jgi:hypothetical protein
VSEGSNDQIPAGWYPTPNGGQRYWDGQRWLALPDPDQPTVYPEEDGDSFSAPTATGTRKKAVIGSVVVALILIAAGVGLVLKNNHDTDLRNAAAASTASSLAAASSSQAAAAASAAAAEAERVQRERAGRAADVQQIEADIKKMAEKQVADGLFDGPVLSASCDPVGGGSTDDLTAKTTIFECFAATHQNDDGTLSGRKYHATMNWDTESWTYGLG